MPRKIETWQAPPQSIEPMPEISGNTVNGLDGKEPRRPLPFFWHPPERQQFGDMQAYTLGIIYGQEDSAAIAEAFALDAEDGFGQRGPPPAEVVQEKVEKSPSQWSKRVKEFALCHRADIAGIAQMRPEWVYEGYEILEKYVIVIGVAHDYEEISQAPSPPGNNRAIVEVGKQYTRAATAAAELANFIRSQGHTAYCFPGPMADALLMIPAAIEAGLGELGKHGSLINRELGSSFRLSAVTTDMPLLEDRPDVFGADDFCTRCQVCSDACPPDAIFPEKQWVRGDKKWYVDFDKCIPYFAETRGCAICIAVCPWSRPGIAEKLVIKMAKRRDRQNTAAKQGS